MWRIIPCMERGSRGVGRMAFLALASAAAIGCAPPEEAPPIRVETSLGAVEGYAVDGVSVFRGIPYAEPPVGARRFRPPAPRAPWTGVLSADRFGPLCPQPGSSEAVGDEDCLYLNVWTPDVGGRRPVMVWIHGGYFIIGGASVEAYDGEELARRGDVVVVSIQYRLGALGHLAHPSLSVDGYDGAGNYAFLDQLEALRWVRREIAAFGGDPESVTIFGESAGGASVCTAVVSPLARGLFHRAIIQSQACPTRSREVAELRGAELAAALGCEEASDVAACLRAADVDDIVAAQPDPREFRDLERLTTSYYPVIDGHLLPDSPRAILAARAHNEVPVISLSTSEEAYLWIDHLTWELLDRGATLLGLTAEQREAAAAYYQDTYAVSRGYDESYARAMAGTHILVTCPESQLLRWLSAAQDTPVYRMLFDFAPIGFYAQHAIEILYLFQHTGVFPNNVVANRASDDFAERTMLELWTGLARSGAPPADAGWPAFEPTTQRYLRLGAGETSVEANLHAEACASFGAAFE